MPLPHHNDRSPPPPSSPALRDLSAFVARVLSPHASGPGTSPKLSPSPEAEPSETAHRSPSPPPGWVELSDSGDAGHQEPAARAASSRTVVLSWGSNTAGQLGLGDYLTRVMPAPVDALAQTTVLALVCGSRTTLALDKEGRVFSWGKGEDGQLGLGERGTVVKPRLVTALLRHPVALLACRGAHVLALDTTGQVWAWGRNDDGQLGVSRGVGDDRERMARPQRVQARVPTSRL